MTLSDCPDGENKEVTFLHILGHKHAQLWHVRGQSNEDSAMVTFLLPQELLVYGTRRRPSKQAQEAEGLQYGGQNTKEEETIEKGPKSTWSSSWTQKATQT